MRETAKPSKGQFTHFVPPTTWGDVYTDKHKEQCIKIIEWMNEHTKSLTWVGKAAHVNRSTLSTTLQGKYTSTPGGWLRKVTDMIDTIKSRDNVRDTPFMPSSVTRLAWTACNRARKYKSFSVLTAEVGTGKTRALMEYRDAHSNTVLIESDPCMSPAVFIEDVANGLMINPGKGYQSKEKKFRLILDAITGRDVLLIIDEAETVNPNTLHYVRRLRDKGGIGVVLAGTPKLDLLISPKGGQFDQIRSRVQFWPSPIRGVTREDADAVITSTFEDLGDIDAKVYQALWHYSRGSMRVLVESLIPAIRDYGLSKHKLSAELVHAVAKDVLSLG